MFSQDVLTYGDAVIVVHANKKQSEKLPKYFIIQQLMQDLPKVIIKVSLLACVIDTCLSGQPCQRRILCVLCSVLHCY